MPAQQRSVPCAFRDHPCGRKRNQSFDDIVLHGAGQHNRHPALGMAAEPDIRNKIKVPGVINHRHRIRQPFVKRVILKLPVTASVTVHIHAERSESDFVQRPGYRHNMPLLHMSGKSMDHNNQRTFFTAVAGPVEFRVQSDAIIHDIHAFSLHAGCFPACLYG